MAYLTTFQFGTAVGGTDNVIRNTRDLNPTPDGFRKSRAL